MRWSVIFWMVTALCAQNDWPEFYAYMGDPIYEDAQGYRELVAHKAFVTEQQLLRQFILKSERALQKGKALRSGAPSSERINYINTLRALQSENAKLHDMLLKRFEQLLKSGNDAVLEDLRHNTSRFISKSKPVTSVGAVHEHQDDNTLHVSASNTLKEESDLWLEHHYRLAKQKLLALRSEGNSDASCMNDITAAYHYMRFMRYQQLQEQWCDALKQYQKVQEYRDKAERTCTNESESFQMLREALKRFDTKMYQIECNKYY